MDLDDSDFLKDVAEIIVENNSQPIRNSETRLTSMLLCSKMDTEKGHCR